MYRDKMILALIPARRGSKGTLYKNIKPLLGKPLIAWTIEQAKGSAYIDRIIVSTDDEKIAEISKRYGAEVPFMRPKELAADDSKIIDVVLHARSWLEEYDKPYDLLMLLQPTAPARTVGDIDRAVELLFEKSAQAIVSVSEAEHHPYRSNILPTDGCMSNFLRPELVNNNRQDLPVFYRLNGVIFLAYWHAVSREKSFFNDKTFAYVMPKERSIDIDDEMDFKSAEFLIKNSFHTEDAKWQK